MLRIVAALIVLLAGCSGGSSSAPPDYAALTQLVGRWEGRADSGIDTVVMWIFAPDGPDLPIHVILRNDFSGTLADDRVTMTADRIDSVAAHFSAGDQGLWLYYAEMVWDRDEPQRILFDGPDNAILYRVD